MPRVYMRAQYPLLMALAHEVPQSEHRNGTPVPRDAPPRPKRPKPPPRAQIPVPDLEVNKPTPSRKRRRQMTPRTPHLTPTQLNSSGMPALFLPTPRTEHAKGHHTPRVIGPRRTTFRSPSPPTPLSPTAFLNLLSSLDLFATSPPSPLCFDGAAPDSIASIDTASTISCKHRNGTFVGRWNTQ